MLMSTCTYRHLGLVVVVLIHIRLPEVQLRRELLIRMRLDGEGRPYLK